MKVMNWIKAGILIGAFFSVNFAKAQEVAEVSDEELKKYAVVMDSIEVMKSTMADKYNERIKSEASMDGGKRFKAIDECGGDAEKLKAANVTAEELAVYQDIKNYYDSLVNDFKATYPELIKSELLGAATYNKVKKALNDAAVKQRYEAVLNEKSAE